MVSWSVLLDCSGDFGVVSVDGGGLGEDLTSCD